MAAPTVYWLNEVAKVLGKSLPVFGAISGFFAWFYDLGEKVVGGGLAFLIEKVDAIDTSAFSNVSFGTVAGIGYANAVFPLAEAITLWGALAAAMLTVIIIRWVKSVIPTVAN